MIYDVDINDLFLVSILAQTAPTKLALSNYRDCISQQLYGTKTIILDISIYKFLIKLLKSFNFEHSLIELRRGLHITDPRILNNDMILRI